MKRFLLPIVTVLIAFSSLASAEEKKTLLQQANEIGRRVDRLAGTEPAKPVVDVKTDEVIITASDLDQAKDAVVELRPEDAKKRIRIVVAKMKRQLEDGKPTIYVSFGKPLVDEYRKALGSLAERDPDIIEARESNPTDIPRLLPLAEKALGLDAKKTPNLSLAERTYRVTWVHGFEQRVEDIIFDFE
jgi:hypothetical protein